MQVIGESRGVRRRQTGVRVRAMLVATLMSTLIAPLAGAQVSVSSGGTPSYGINIGVPPGIAGMSPNLSLAYTGGGVNGPVGYGWTLTGVSLVTRCPGNKATDGIPIAVAYSTGDRLCLDGQRLIQTSTSGVPTASTPAANGALLDANGLAEDGSYTEYRTEKDIYSRIRAYGMANGATANGPRYFKVWTKAGQIYEYGAGPSTDTNSNSLITPYGGTVAAAWAVSRISDTVGNFIDFKYSHRDIPWGSGPTAGAMTGHEWNLAEIQYTGNGSQIATNKVVFEYEDRADNPSGVQDRSEAYHRGFKNVSVARLKAVRTYVNWPATMLGVTMPGGALVTPPSTAVKVKTLKISYEHGPASGRSRLITTQECAGTAETTCLPGPSFHYAPASTNEVFVASAAFGASSLATLQLEKADGTTGMLLGDFNGDGRTDLIRWSTTPGQNLLYTSNGDVTGNGDVTFTPQPGFGLSNVTLFDTAGCYSSIVMDFNGDGKADVLRVMQPVNTSGASCGTPVNVLYLSKGDGTFTAVTLPSTISLAQAVSTSSSTGSCTVPNVKTAGSNSIAAANPMAVTACTNPPYTYSRTAGANFHILDVNGDGIPDIVTTILPSYSKQQDIPDDDSLCASKTCTHVYLGSPSGTFTEYTTTNLANHSVYGAPRSGWGVIYRPNIGDVDGDGLMDLMVDTGTWRSLGTGDFSLLSSNPAFSCAYPLDFNGDGRYDCLHLNAPAFANTLNVGDGTGSYPSVAGFNLAAGGVLTPTSTTVGAGVGVVLADLDADGRTDLIRWADDPTKNTVYLSNGDGTFRASTLFNLNTAAYALKKSDGSIDFVTGDFTGNGNTEILRTVSTITAGSTATTNQLFVKKSNVPPEQLSSMTSPTGLASTLTYVTLPNSSSGSLGPRYQPGPSFLSPAVYPKIDLTIPMWVVATVETASGVGSLTTKDEYAYGGLRATYDGHGLLGFQTVSEQHSAGDGSPLTTVTSYLQDGAYIGVAGTTKTLDGALNATSAPIISRTTNSYCDTTSSGSPAAVATPGTAPPTCATTSVVQRPYLYQSVEEGWDIDSNRTALPTVTTTNAFSGSGDATQISVSTSGTAVGLQQVVTKVTNNTFLPDNTAGDAWILGRLQQSTQTNTVPNSLASISTSAGTAKYATATTGESLGASLTVPAFPTTYIGQSSTVNATLQNTSSGALGVTPPTPASVTGTDFSFLSTTCTSSLAQSASCTVSIQFTPSAAVARSGTVTVQNEANRSSAGLSGQGALTPVALTLSSCVSTTPVTAPAAASMSCQVGNTGQTNASGIAYSSNVSGMTFSGPTSCAAGTTNCGTVTVTTPTTVGSYVGTLVATPSSGNAGSASFNLSVLTPAALNFSCSTTSSNMTCTLSNTGGSAATGITYAISNPNIFSFGGVTTCAAMSSCGSITLTPSSNPPGTDSGTFTATPASGSAASVGFSFYVPFPPNMALTSCTQQSPVTTPSHASMTCSVVNNGDTAASSLSYSVPSGMTVSGPSGACAGHTTCGSVTVSTTTSGTFTGSLVVTPNLGSAASQSINLTQAAPAALAFTVVTSTGLTTTFKNPNSFAVTPTDSGVSTDGRSTLSSNTCGASVSAGGTCSITITAPPALCIDASYTAQAYVTDSGGTAWGTLVTRSSTKPCQ